MSDLFLDEVIQPEPEQPGRRAARSGGRDDRERRRRQRRRRTVISLVVAFALLGGTAYALVQFAGPLLEQFRNSQEQEEASDFPGPGGPGTVDVTIPEGASGAAMGQVLEEAGVVASTRAFSQAFAADDAAGGIQPGTYRMLVEMPAASALAALLDPANKVQTRVTIPEGLSVVQMIDRLSSVTAVPVEEFEAAMADTEATGLPAEAEGNYEGWLFPSTYTFQPGVTPSDMIATMVGQTKSLLEERGVAPEDYKEILTIASLVEREARSPEDRQKVARAIQNRMDQGMKLDIDASVAYGLGKPGTQLTREDTQTDGPYNLYTRTGLPPTPIAAPSLTSIDAVLNPADGPWLFWVTVNLDTGETRFAETLGEHNQNVQLLREWQAENG